MTETASRESLESLLRDALAHHRQGELAQAVAGYDAILAIDPDHFDALHLKGVIAAQQGRAEEAVALMRRAIAIRPDHAGAYGNLGSLLLRLGRAEEALACLDSLTALQPEHPGAHRARANALHMLGRLDQAVAAYDRTLALDATNADAWYNRGNALQALGRARDALASHDKAVSLRSDHVNAIYSQGNALQALGSLPEALARYEAALELKDDHFEAHSSRGNALRLLGRLDEALASHDRAVALKPADADAHYNHGTTLAALGRSDEALASYDRALALKPDHAGALAGRGTMLRDLGRPDEALASYDRALSVAAHAADTWSNRGVLLLRLLRLDEALQSFDRAIGLDPEHVDAQWNRANTLLLSGDFARGLPAFEWRWRTKGGGRPGSWRGAAIAGRSILLSSEQGLGDTIQFARYAPMVKALGARPILSVQAPLARLMSSLDPDIDVVTTRDITADLDCPLMSLPLAFGTTLPTIPAPPRYLAAEPDAIAAWRERLPFSAGRRIGVVWAGNPAQGNDRNRSMPLTALEPLLEVEAQWISLQKDIPARDATLLARLDVLRVGEELRDFADTAALIESLDLVITVCTSVAHLAGALGKPVWIMLAYSADWRWFTGREDSPWYPSARLFRQTAPADWAGVVRRIAETLR